MKPTYLILCAAALAACSSSAPAWQKPGATPTQASEALQDCRMKARLSPQQHLGALEPRGSGTPNVNRIEDRDTVENAHVDRCMRDKGYAAGTR